MWLRLQLQLSMLFDSSIVPLLIHIITMWLVLIPFPTYIHCNILISFRMRIAIYSIETIRYKVLSILFVSFYFYVNTSDSLLGIKSNSLHIDYTEIKFIGRTNHIEFAWYWTYFFPLCFRSCNYMRWRRIKLITKNKMNLWSRYKVQLQNGNKEREKKLHQAKKEPGNFDNFFSYRE